MEWLEGMEEQSMVAVPLCQCIVSWPSDHHSFDNYTAHKSKVAGNSHA